MDWVDLTFACLSPQRAWAGFRKCRREGCGRRLSLRLAVRALGRVSGLNWLDEMLAQRLERSMWIAEHPGCTRGDVDAWENELIAELLAEIEAKMARIKAR